MGQSTRRQRTRIAPLRPAGFSACSHRSSVTLLCSTRERAGLGRYPQTFLHPKSIYIYVEPHTEHCVRSSCVLLSILLWSNSQQCASFPLRNPLPLCYQVHNFMLGLNLNTSIPFSPITEVTYHSPPPEEEVDAVTGKKDERLSQSTAYRLKGYVRSFKSLM